MLLDPEGGEGNGSTHTLLTETCAGGLCQLCLHPWLTMTLPESPCPALPSLQLPAASPELRL